MSHGVCARVCGELSHCTRSQLPPCDEIQMEPFSALPTLLTIMAPQIFDFIFYFRPRLSEILWTHSDYSAFAVAALISLKRAS